MPSDLTSSIGRFGLIAAGGYAFGPIGAAAGALLGSFPMRFRRRGGRKRIVAPDGSELAPSSKPRPDGTPIKAPARAWRGSVCSMRGLHLRERDRRHREHL
jgi:hypothetical protein